MRLCPGQFCRFTQVVDSFPILLRSYKVSPRRNIFRHRKAPRTNSHAERIDQALTVPFAMIRFMEATMTLIQAGSLFQGSVRTWRPRVKLQKRF